MGNGGCLQSLDEMEPFDSSCSKLANDILSIGPGPLELTLQVRIIDSSLLDLAFEVLDREKGALGLDCEFGFEFDDPILRRCQYFVVVGHRPECPAKLKERRAWG